MTKITKTEYRRQRQRRINAAAAITKDASALIDRTRDLMREIEMPIAENMRLSSMLYTMRDVIPLLEASAREASPDPPKGENR